MLGDLCILRPSDTQRGRLDGEHLPLPRSHNVEDAFHAAPLGSYQEEPALRFDRHPSAAQAASDARRPAPAGSRALLTARDSEAFPIALKSREEPAGSLNQGYDLGSARSSPHLVRRHGALHQAGGGQAAAD